MPRPRSVVARARPVAYVMNTRDGGCCLTGGDQGKSRDHRGPKGPASSAGSASTPRSPHCSLRLPSLQPASQPGPPRSHPAQYTPSSPLPPSSPSSPLLLIHKGTCSSSRLGVDGRRLGWGVVGEWVAGSAGRLPMPVALCLWERARRVHARRARRGCSSLTSGHIGPIAIISRSPSFVSSTAVVRDATRDNERDGTPHHP